YSDKDGNPHTVATLEDGLKFAGDNGDNENNIIKKALNEKLEIVGGADKDKLSDNNIGVNAKDGKLEVKLSKELKELTSAEFKDADGNVTNITGNGIVINPDSKNSVSLTKDGLNNGGNKITNVADATEDTDAVNKKQLDEAAAASRTEITANNGEAANGTTGNVVLTSTQAKDGHTVYDVKLNDKVTLGTDPTKQVVLDGTTGEVKAGGVTVNKDNAGTINGLTNKTWNVTNPTAVTGQAATEDQLKAVNDHINSEIANYGFKVIAGKEGTGTTSGTVEESKVS
ncbi:adhesin, partial [Streptobacillus felis]|nr:adhesin [Streptobacillus felis]